MGNDDRGELEVTTPAGSARARGYRLIDLVWFPMTLGVAYSSMTLYNHEAGAQTERQNSVAAMKEANKAIVEALDKQGAATIKALEKLTEEQKRSTRAQIEMTCIVTLPEQQRRQAADFCKRMAREQP